MRALIACLIAAAVAAGVFRFASSAQAGGEESANLPAAAAPGEVRRNTPSGLPVPRFATLKSHETYGRMGPSFDYPVRWTMKRKGMPVEIIAETADHWRKVIDPQGDEMWVHATMLTGARTVYVRREGVALRAEPYADAAARARLGAGVIATPDRCERGWCFIEADGYEGWLPRDAVWGLTDAQASGADAAHAESPRLAAR